MKTLRLIGNSVLLGPIPQQQKSPGGIHYAPNYADDRKRWRVLAVGPGRRTKRGVLLAPECAPGDNALVEIDLVNSRPIDDGTGRIVVDASSILMVWSNNNPQQKGNQ